MLFKNPNILPAICFTLTMFIGALVFFLPLDGIECQIIYSMQNFTQETIGIQFFKASTYLGDIYLWTLFSLIYLSYTYFEARKHFSSAFKLVAFMIIVTTITYLLKIGFARPRPSCPNITVYDQEEFFSYPSGHSSRTTGAFSILSGKSKIIKSLAIIVIFLVSLSRIVLGVHYPTDVIGGIFLSFATQKLADHLTKSYFKS